MAIGPALKRLWRHSAFRRLLTVKVFTQAGDGTLQVGLASYILFSPQNQPDAWAIAGVLALTLMPFSIVGPFVSPRLDQWSRRQVVVYSDIIRASLTAVIGVIIAASLTTGAWQLLLFGSLLIAVSINRFMLAGLTAGMQHTVEEDEYLSASSILPTVGPLGVVLGTIFGFATRLGFGDFLSADQANAAVFGVAAILFVSSVLTARRFSKDALGPDPNQPRTHVRDVTSELGAAWRHLRSRPHAAIGLGGLFGTRMLFGMLSVIVILAVRNHFHTDVLAALGDLTFWGILTGAGFILATPVVPLLARPLGLRRTVVVVLLIGAVAQMIPLLLGGQWPLFVVSFFVGLAAQAFKICVDTLVQAHVDEAFKGRVFIFFDMAFNTAFVAAAVVAALLLPDTGLSVAGFVAMTLAWVALAVWFLLRSRRIGVELFEKGTEDLTGRREPTA